MHLGSLEHDAWGRGVWELGGGAEERIEAIDCEEVPKPVDTKVAVDVVRVDVVLVCVDSRTAYQLLSKFVSYWKARRRMVRSHQIKSVLLLPNAIKDLFRLFQVPKIAANPFNNSLGMLRSDFGDRLFALFFLAIDHDYPRVGKGQSASYFVPS